MTLQPLVHLHQKDAPARGSGLRYLNSVCVFGPMVRASTMPNTQTALPEFAGRAKAPREQPKQSNYELIIDELFWLRASYDDQVNQIFDLTELIGRLAEKIEQWVGVAEE